jgi:hypothetical protein
MQRPWLSYTISPHMSYDLVQNRATSATASGPGVSLLEALTVGRCPALAAHSLVSRGEGKWTSELRLVQNPTFS